ncbi:MAG TPA: UDP-N-acetylmuramoyl-L-alanyl-D-glutamate--2,6-diaminopimelate ligase, partial [Thermoanaerobaculia bacterium]|nr:UDP-N-acetylmuramoyl-L-alanyl-D-glutamate--2,6-diaminopimelate ligase [Thermoanaerobaculia bacterium]
MKLEEIIEGLALSIEPASNPEISSVVSDSRRVTPGALFVAIAGERADGLSFAGDAIRKGAAAVASDRPRPEGFAAPWVRVGDPRLAASVWSQRALGDPWKRLRLAGVTGTNGKTTTAMLLSGVFRRAWGSSGFVGTTGYGWKGTALAAPRTTPEGDELARMMSEMVHDGVPACAMEVSSHAVALERVSGVRFDAAVFTNLTRDHLDFHGTMEAYGAAKERLFSLRKPGGAAVVNVDDPWGRAMAARLSPPVFTFSPSGDRAARCRAADVEVSLSGTRFRAVAPEAETRVESPLVGRFHVENLLAAWTAARALGVPAEAVAGELAENPGAPGRMERVDAG